MDENLTLQEMFDGLLAYKQYVLKDTLRSEWKMFKNGTLRYYTPSSSNEIHLTEGDDGYYFSYTHQGSSAVTADKDELKWVLETIFKKDPSDFTELNHHAILDVINEER